MLKNDRTEVVRLEATGDMEADSTNPPEGRSVSAYTLDYGQLLKKAKRLSAGHRQKVKLALLGDVSVQHLVPLLRVLFASNGVDVEIYEAGYDTVELEAYNPASELYVFQPQFIVILQSVTKLKDRFYDGAGSAESFSQSQADKLEGVWKAIQDRMPSYILQSNFVLPYERPFGNYGRKVVDDLQGAVMELNREIGRRAKLHPNVFINDIDQLASWVGRRNFIDEKLWALAKALCALEFLPHVAQSVVDISLAALGRVVKCVVLDLDNTLWGGVVGDDGLEGIGLGDLDEGGAFYYFQLFLRSLAQRGIILAVCSKNNEAIAREVFQKHPAMVLKEEYIAVFVANWEDKAANIKRIRDTLNIGYDSMVFLDDNPFERNLVRRLLPQVIVPELPEDPALYLRAISELNLFETASSSTLDSKRNALYQDQQKREAETQKFATIEEYLQSLKTVADCRRFEPQNLGRIAQLIQRSNQFNLTTQRYSEAECKAMMEDEEHYFPFTISVKDRFGDFGLINVAILHLDQATRRIEIDTFLMSCRVLQRGVEQLAVNKIFEFGRQANYQCVVGRYIPTAKNMMVKNFFQQFGFQLVQSSNDGTAEWQLETNQYTPRTVFIQESSAETFTAPHELIR